MKASVLTVAAVAAFAVPAFAQISIIGDVTNTTVAGNFGTTAPDWADATQYHYYTFTATAGSLVTFSASRTTEALDPTIFIYAGNMGGTAFDGTNPYNAMNWLGFSFAAFADDEIDVPGPWGDPSSSFTAGVTGTYTVVVLSNASDTPGPDGLGYTLTVVPAPASLALLGLAGLATRRRR